MAEVDYGKKVLDVMYDMVLKKNSLSVVVSGLETVQRILINIHENPEDEKYRTIRTRGKTFQGKIGKMEGGVELMMSLGFRQTAKDFEEWLLYTDSEQHLIQGLEIVEKNLKRNREALELSLTERRTKAELREEERQRIMLGIEADKQNREHMVKMGRFRTSPKKAVESSDDEST
ncbi:hypothetical protein NDN08_006176 [Rhodosorus marinus]|uniref:PUB domain-containing protein n=1 Tax=Rhodosorus marinus TaxID=101924 RepID=A0AAV8UK31_9RHOD|nr:hypothetical protein NDN08_006176 [Rhodosorus marinus]